MCPTSIQNRVHKARAYHSLAIERVFLKDDIARSSDTLCSVQSQFKRLYSSARSFLSYHDYLRFSTLLAENDSKQQVKLLAKYEKNIKWLRAKRYGSFKPNMDTIINLANTKLSPVQKELLCRGAEFGIPPSNNRKEIVLTQFEMFTKSSLRILHQCLKISVLSVRLILEPSPKNTPKNLQTEAHFHYPEYTLRLDVILRTTLILESQDQTRVELQLLSAHKSTIRKWRSSLRTRVSLSNSVRYLLMTTQLSREKVE